MRHQVVRKCLLLSLILIPVACNNTAKQFSDALSRAVMDGDGTIVALRELTHFEWDKVYVYGSYAPYGRINGKHGTRLHSWIGEDYVPESEFLLLFLSGSQVVAVVRHPRNRGDFSEIIGGESETAYTPQDAIFRVELAGREGSPHLIEAGASGPQHAL